MRVRLLRVVEDGFGTRAAELEDEDGILIGLALEQGDLESCIEEALERYSRVRQRVEIPLPSELKDKEFDI